MVGGKKCLKTKLQACRQAFNHFFLSVEFKQGIVIFLKIANIQHQSSHDFAECSDIKACELINKEPISLETSKNDFDNFSDMEAR